MQNEDSRSSEHPRDAIESDTPDRLERPDEILGNKDAPTPRSRSVTPLDESINRYLDDLARPLRNYVVHHNQQAIDSLLRSIRRQYDTSKYTPDLSAVIKQLATQPSLSRPGDFSEQDSPTGPYSPELKSPGTYFESTERVVNSYEELNDAISKLISKTPSLPLVWRGVGNADWGLYSSLYRRLLEENGVELPQARPEGDQPYPDEEQMVAAEKEILRLTRADWRFDHLNALETFARLQHVGGPTRLIDVTRNPHIAAWFAVEYNEALEGKDARLFAIATKPVQKPGRDSPPDGTIHLDDLGSGRDPFWHQLIDHESRQGFDWGTGSRRRLWIPPAYDKRISAQNAAFILDGVPMTSSKTSRHFRIEGQKYWKRSDLLAASSIYLKMFKSTQKPQWNAPNFAPTFSFRITAGAKEQIRDVMESNFGYRTSYIYPDMQGLANYLKGHALADS